MSYLDEISDKGYYLNAFNNLLKRRQMETAAQNPMQAPMENQMMGGGSERTPAWNDLSNAQKAAFYSDNPTFAAITQFGQKALGYAPFGVGMAMKAQELMFPQFVAEQTSIARGVDPGTGLQVGGYGSQPGTSGITPTGLYGDQFAGMPAPAKPDNFFASLLNGILPSSNVSLTPAPVEDKTPTPNPIASVSADAGIGGSPAQADGGADSGGSGRTSGGNYGGDAYGGSYQFNQGGMVTPERLMGRAPAPDDGYGALQGGEYVITKAAVERYGKAMMDAINNGTFR